MSFATMKKSSKSVFAAIKDKATQEKTGGGGFSDDRYWNIEDDKAGNGFAVIRFLPSVDGEEFPFVKLFSHGFKIGTKWYIENCPSTLNNNFDGCPVCQSNTEYYSTGLEADKNFVRARKSSRQLRYHANILVISDPKHPENDGKNFLFSFGQKIFDKITSAIEPAFEDETAFNPFDFWDGADFKLKIRQVEGYRNYDKSEFVILKDKNDQRVPTPLFDGDDAKLEDLWKKEYPLKPIIDPSAFKSYVELKAKFDKIVGNVSSVPAPVPQESTPEEPEAPSARAPQKAAPAESKISDDDDDFAMYSKLLND